MIRLRTHTATLSCASCKRSTRTWELGPTYRWDQVLLIIMISQDIIITICSARHYDESSVLQPRTQTAIGGYHRLIQVLSFVSAVIDIICIDITWSLLSAVFIVLNHYIDMAQFFAILYLLSTLAAKPPPLLQLEAKPLTRRNFLHSSARLKQTQPDFKEIGRVTFLSCCFVAGDGAIKRKRRESEVCGQQ